MTDFYFDDFVITPPDEEEPPVIDPAPTSFWFDTFTAPDATNLADHTSDSGSDYTYITAGENIVIQGNRARSNGQASVALLNALPTQQEYDIDFILERFGAVDGGRAGVTARTSMTEGTRYSFYYDDSGHWAVSNGTQPIATFEEALNAGTYLCRVEIRTDLKRLLVFDTQAQDWIEKVSTTDNQFIEGHAGLIFRGTMTANTGTHIEVIQAVPLREEFYADMFQAADGTQIQNHTSDSGHNYTALQGAATILNNRLRSASANRGAFLVDVTPPGPVYAFEFEFEHFSNIPAGRVGVFARAVEDPIFYSNDFSNEALNQQPANTTRRWATQNVTYAVRNISGFSGGRGLECSHTTPTADKTLSFDVTNGTLDVGIRNRTRVTTPGGIIVLGVLRGSGNAGSETGYQLHLATMSQEIRIGRASNGSHSWPAVLPFTFEAGDILDVEFEVENVGGQAQLRGFVWPADSPKPGTPTITYTDPNPLGAGWVGVGVRQFETRIDIDSVEVYSPTGGDLVRRAYYFYYDSEAARWQIQIGPQDGTILATLPETLAPGTYRCLVEVGDEVKRLSVWDGEQWIPKVSTQNNTLADTGSIGLHLGGQMGEASGSHLAEITAIQIGEPDPDPPDPIDTAPQILGISAPAFNRVDLTIQPDSSGNATNHDVHRIVGNTNFDPAPGNLHLLNIGLTPPTPTIDTSNVQENTTYSYRVTGKAGSQIISVSDRRVVTTPLENPPAGDYPHLPSNFNDLMFVHDCSSFPPPNTTGSFAASEFGVIGHHEATWGAFGNDGGNLTGAIAMNRYRFRHGPIDGTPNVQHGPINPHGKAFAHRIRYSRGNTTTGLADGGTSQLRFRHPDNLDAPFRSIYMHFWFLFEGFPAFGTRCIRRGLMHRFHFQANNCATTDRGGLLAFRCSGASRSAETGVCGQPPLGDPITHNRIEFELSTLAQNSGPPSGDPGTGAYSNGAMSSTGGRGWRLLGPSCGVEVGRWHRLEIIIRHSDADVENGSIRLYLNGSLVRALEPIITRSNVFLTAQGCPTNSNPPVIANGWYYGPNWYRGYHPGGSTLNPNAYPNDQHNRYCSFADFFYAGIRA